MASSAMCMIGRSPPFFPGRREVLLSTTHGKLLFFFNRHHLSPAVIAAGTTDTVRQNRVPALGADRPLRDNKRVVRAPLVAF